MRVARENTSFWAEIIERRPLVFDGEAPWPHVRAASAIAVLPDKRLIIAQDDTSYLAEVGARVVALPLPIDGGRALYDARDGTKKDKPDLEAAAMLGLDQLLLFGSGSTPKRERIAVIPVPSGTARIVPLPSLYEALRAAVCAPLNIEGAAALGSEMRLLQRGNGAGGVDAVLSVPLAWLAVQLSSARPPSDPPPVAIQRWDLGDLAGCRLSFTDGHAEGKDLVFLAAAEDSPDTFDDGVVTGSVIGRLSDEEAWWTPLRWASGEIARIKAEGLAPAGGDRFFVTTDPDDPDSPSELLTIRLHDRGSG